MAELVHRPLDELLAVRLLRDVARHGDGLAARLGDEPHGLLGVLVFVQIGNQHVRALAGEGQGDGAADARVRAGDERDAVPQLFAADIGVFAVVRLDIHIRLVAGRRDRFRLAGRSLLLGFRVLSFQKCHGYLLQSSGIPGKAAGGQLEAFPVIAATASLMTPPAPPIPVPSALIPSLWVGGRSYKRTSGAGRAGTGPSGCGSAR